MQKALMALRKAVASAVNVSIVVGGTSPVYWTLGVEWWRGSCIVLFFGYSLLLSRRCLGQVVARTYQNEPTSPAYAALYTASFATLLWWVWLPLDIAMVNGLFVQLPCLMIWGNTPHGLLTGRRTMTERENIFDAVMRGRCPDCGSTTLVRENSYLTCARCDAFFFADEITVCRAVRPEKKTEAA